MIRQPLSSRVATAALILMVPGLPVARAAAADEGPAPTAGLLQALEQRLDALQQQNAAQQAELDRMRAVLARLARANRTVAGAGSGPAASKTVAVAADGPKGPPPVRSAPAADVPAAIPSAAAVAAALPVASTDPATGLKSAPTERSVRDVYQQQNLSFERRLTITPSFTHAYSDNRYFTLNGFLALGAIFLGNVDVTQQRSDISIAQLNATYGVSDRLQLEALAPYYTRDSDFTSVGANFSSKLPAEDVVRSSGLGDVQAGASYQLRRETPDEPAVSVNAHVSVPTGRAPYGIKLVTDASDTSLQFPSRLPTGSGVFGFEVGGSFVKTVDPAIFFGGLNYYAQTARHFNDLSFDATTRMPGVAMPGNAVQYQLGTAFALNEKTSISFSFVDTVAGDTSLRPDHGSFANVVGSGTNAAVLDISAGLSENERRTLVTDLQLGLTRDAPNFQFGIRMPTRF